MSVVTRIAPSPTGPLHIGTARTALFNYLHAKKNSGKFILRIEDTDTERSSEPYAEDIEKGLNWLGLVPNEKYKQSDRKDIYSKYIQKLLDEDSIYISDEKGEGSNESVIRLRNPGENVSFNDSIRDDITFNTAELGDFVVARDKESPLYHLAVVIDDHEMGITDVIRGEDHISNTPRQILIQKALGISRPRYAHIPLILAPDRSKLSKREGDTTSIADFRERGYLPQALVSYMALLGWNPGTDQELFTLEELVSQFDIRNVQKGGAIFSKEKLDWINGKYLGSVTQNEAYEIVRQHLPADLANLPQYSEERVRSASVAILERVDVPSMLENPTSGEELTYFFDTPSYNPADLNWRDSGSLETKAHLEVLRDLISGIQGDPTADIVKKAIWNYATEKGRGTVLWPLRFALTGAERSPDPFSISAILGKEESVKRIDHAISQLENRNS
jgi:glutamyl-tRNA synthetase